MATHFGPTVNERFFELRNSFWYARKTYKEWLVTYLAGKHIEIWYRDHKRRAIITDDIDVDDNDRVTIHIQIYRVDGAGYVNDHNASYISFKTLDELKFVEDK
jgi:hypothetical protein